MTAEAAPTGPRRGRLAGAILSYGLGAYVPRIANFVLIPLYTRFLTPADFGVVDIYVTIGATLSILMRAGLPGAVSRFYFDHTEGEGVRDLYTAVALVFAVVGPPMIGAQFPDTPVVPFFWLILAQSWISPAPLLQQRLLQAREQAKRSASLSATFGLTTTGLTFLFVVFIFQDAFGVLLASLIAQLVYAVQSVWLQRDDLRGRFRRELLSPVLRYGLPLLPHHLAASLHQYVGRWLLNATTSVAVVGHLGLATRLASPLLVVTGAYANAYAPVFFSWRKTLSPEAALAEARRVGRTTATLGAIAVAGAACFGALVVRHALDAAYAPSAPLVGVVAAALLANLLYTHLVTEVFYAKTTQWISVIFVVSAVVNVVALLAVVDRWGAMAAALAQVAGGVVSAIMAAALARQTFPLTLALRPVLAASVVSVLACLVPIVLTDERPAVEMALMSGAFVALSGLALALSGGGTAIVGDAVGLVRRRRRKKGASPGDKTP
jgi:O-antigen/teichoic acid export membrane protein